MKNGSLVSILLSAVMIGCLLPADTVCATEESVAEEQAVAQWKSEASVSLNELGAKSPYYTTGQWNDPNAQLTAKDYTWFQQSDYSLFCDPYYGICLIKNAVNTSIPEATPSTGVLSEVESSLGVGCLPDFSNMFQMRFTQDSIGITAEELATIPLPAACTSWRNPLEYQEEMINYSLNYHNLIWAHKGSYRHYSDGVFEGITGRKLMECPLIDSAFGYPIGCHVTRFDKDDTYGGKCYNGAIRGIYVSYPYPNPTWFVVQRTFSITYGANKVKINDDTWYDDVWNIQFTMCPNEMDLQHLHGLLRLITPDADVIFSAIYEDFYGENGSSPFSGYGAWKYYDKWYDIGTQSRICSSYCARTEEQSEKSNPYMGYVPTSFTYKIAPRVGVTAPGYDAIIR